MKGSESLCLRLFHWAIPDAIGLAAAGGRNCAKGEVAGCWRARLGDGGRRRGRSQKQKQARSPMHAGQNDAPLLIRP